MEVIWQTMLFRLAEHAQVIIPALIGIGVVGLGPIGRAIARRIAGITAERAELETLRQQVAELQERSDYTERLLGTLRSQLPSPSKAPVKPVSDDRPVTPL